LDGKQLAEGVLARVRTRARDFQARTGVRPGLGVVLIGDDPASAAYVRNKERAAAHAGFHSRVERLPATISNERALALVEELGRDPQLHGLLIQLPVPKSLSIESLQSAVPPGKDVDGLHPLNAGALVLGRTGLVPCTPRGVIEILEHAGTPLEGAHAVVVGRSAIVGKPVALLLLQRGATVTICHSKTRHLAALTRSADVLVVACGVPGLIRAEHVRAGAIVIDVGIHEITDPAQAGELLQGQPERLARFETQRRTLVGDVLWGEVQRVAQALTPVPGGVGPMTVAMLLENTLIAAERTLRSDS
jgi:methylenetetrahydrofolate dehydrogenase (NADP+)/methenyltetrahydrofolate cyclohydrolase